MKSTSPNEALSLSTNDGLFPLSPPEQKRGRGMGERGKEEREEGGRRGERGGLREEGRSTLTQLYLQHA
jgi:hypothetical protein